jgi:zinc/manganese transport system substrate-binding protein
LFSRDSRAAAGSLEMRKAIVRSALLVAFLSLLGMDCARAAERPLRVIASFTVVADWVQVVGGDEVAVRTLVGPDADAHVYEPTPTDVREVAAADVLVMNGLGFEGWMSRLVQSSGFHGRTLEASRGVRTRNLNGKVDPHAWQDLGNATIYVRNIADGLASVRSDGADRFRARAEAYVRELEGLDRYTRKAIDAIPRERRIVITSHDAFGYFADAYGFTMVPAQGLSTESEPSAATVGRLIREIRGRHVQALFVENIRNPRLMERIAKEGGATVGGRLYSDALGSAKSPAATFLDMYRYNVAALVSAVRTGGDTTKPRPSHE